MSLIDFIKSFCSFYRRRGIADTSLLESLKISSRSRTQCHKMTKNLMSKQGTKVKVKTTTGWASTLTAIRKAARGEGCPTLSRVGGGRAGDVNYRPAPQTGTPSQTGQRAPQATTASPGRPARFPTPPGTSPSPHSNTRHVLPAHLQPLRVHGFPKARPQAS